MTYETYSLIAKILLSLCGLFFLISVFLFIYFKIGEVVGYLSGTDAKKQIERIRNNNTKSVPLKMKKSANNTANETELLSSGETEVLVSEEPPFVNSSITEVLSGRDPLSYNRTEPSGDHIQIENSIVFIHTDEVIP